MEPPPLLLIVDAVATRRAFVRAHLAPLGWRVAEAGHADAPHQPADAPVLVLLDPALPGAGGVVRRFGDIPVLAFAGDGRTEGVDAVVAWPCTPEALVAAIRPWQPAGMTLDRLATVFGVERLAALLADFDTQLGDALARPGIGDAGLAHRIGGLAGTLGFARLSAAWLAVSEGDAAATPRARAEALAARAVIAARRGG